MEKKKTKSSKLKKSIRKSNNFILFYFFGIFVNVSLFCLIKKNKFNKVYLMSCESKVNKKDYLQNNVVCLTIARLFYTFLTITMKKLNSSMKGMTNRKLEMIINVSFQLYIVISVIYDIF